MFRNKSRRFIIMRIISDNKISISKEEIKNAFFGNAGDEVMFKMPEGYYIASHDPNRVVISDIKLLSERIAELVVNDDRLRYAHNSMSIDNLKDILTFWLIKEKAENYTENEIISMKDMIVDGFNALWLPPNAIKYYCFGYIELCIVLCGIFLHKTSIAISAAIDNQYHLNVRMFEDEHFRALQLMEIKHKLFS